MKKIFKLICTLLLIGVIVGLRLINFSFEFLEKKEVKKEEFVGIVRVYDIGSRTVLGSKFTFINTICEEFSSPFRQLKMELYEVSDYTPGKVIDSIMLNKSNVDVIRNDIDGTSISRDAVIRNEALTSSFNMQYKDFIHNDYGDRLIIDMYYNIGLVIYNMDLISSLEIEDELPSSKEEFFALLEKIKVQNDKRSRRNKINVLDYDRGNANRTAPFLIGNSDEVYIKELTTYLPKGKRSILDVNSDFFLGETAIFFGDLDYVNTLMRNEKKEDSFLYKYTNYPTDEEFVYVSEIASYAFISSSEKKNELLEEFARYMMSESALKYTENLGKLPCQKNINLKYEMYPHLIKLSNQDIKHYTYRDVLQ